MNFTFEDLKQAYIKLKSFIYYDNAEILLRKKLIEFENFDSLYDSDNISEFEIDNKLQFILIELNRYNENPKFFDNIIKNKIKVVFFPKKFKEENQTKKILTNKRVKDNYELERVTAFIDAPIEIHLLSVLWIMKKGVFIDAGLDAGCLGNRLLLNKDKKAIVKGSGLFKPYFKQYQKWRDDSVRVAQELISKDKNVLFLNLDVKDYFHSVRISIDYFSNEETEINLGLKNISSLKNTNLSNLNSILLKIHVDYTKKISKKYSIPNSFYSEIIDENKNIQKFILPIGLLSSYVIANEYLKDFDKIITEKFKPAYYSRYVDDILIVISDPNPLSFESEKHKGFKFDFEKYELDLKNRNEILYDVGFKEEDLDDVEKYVLYNFYPLFALVNYPYQKYNVKDGERIFKIIGYESMFCQSDKTMLYYFDSSESDLVIDKLKKELDEKTSEFRDMPSDDEGFVDFESNAYHLSYDGHEGKIRTLKDYKENRYGLTVYLTNRIFIALRKEEIISEKEKDQVLKFFMGENCLTFYRLWERIFTLFLVNNQAIAYTEFYCHCVEQIEKMIPSPKKNLLGEFDNVGKTKVKYSNVQDSLRSYLNCAHELVLSLNPNFIENVKLAQRHLEFKTNQMLYPLDFNDIWIKGYRKSNMMRHQYIITPLLNYTRDSKLDIDNLTGFTLTDYDFKLDENLLKNSPRPVKFWECCIAILYSKLSRFKFEKLETNIDGNHYTYLFDSYFLGNIENTYLDEAFEIYLEANINHRNGYENDEDLKKYFFNHRNRLKNERKLPFLKEIKVTSAENKFSNKPLISFANTKVETSNILDSLDGNPNLTAKRYQKLALILKKARKEKSEIVIFPESFVPIDLLSTLARYSQKNQSLVVTGMEHIVVDKTAFNFVVTILPHEVNGIKDATVVFRLKNNYAPDEVKLILERHLFVPKPLSPRIDVFNWRNIYFSVAYCFEMANITHRSKLKGKIDLLIGIEYNKDTPYFSNIVESTSRDLHCYVAQVNTSHYGDTRLIKPSDSATKDLLRLKGGTNDTILVSEINIELLRNFQRKKFILIGDEKKFKPLPPDYYLEDVLKRIDNNKIT